MLSPFVIIKHEGVESKQYHLSPGLDGRARSRYLRGHFSLQGNEKPRKWETVLITPN